jgi:hypothetical protein
MSNETTYLPWTVGQLHPEMRAKGCEHLYAVFSESKIAPNVKQTVAENSRMVGQTPPPVVTSNSPT